MNEIKFVTQMNIYNISYEIWIMQYIQIILNA